MSSRSSTSSSRRSLVLGTALLGLACAGVARSRLAPIGFFGGSKLAEKYVKLEALEREGDVRVFFVGPSFVDQGIDAELFSRLTGKTTFNLAVSGTDLYLQSLYVRDVLIPIHRPEAILWGTRDATLTRSAINVQYLEAPALRFAHSWLGARGFALAEELPHYRKRRIEDWVAALSGERTETVDAFGQTELVSASRPQRSGAGEAGDEGEDGEGAGGSSFLRDDFAVDLEEARAVFADTLRRARENGVRVIFFLTPYYESVFRPRTSYARTLASEEFAEYARWLTRTLAENDVPLVNLRYCAEVSRRPECFYDTRHLNETGAEPTSEILARIFSGERAIPSEWTGVPSRAELEAIQRSR